MFKRHPGKSDSEEASSYSRRAAATDSLWLAQDRVRTGTGSAFERLGFVFQERLIWPLQDRTATMGAPARALSVATAALLASGAVTAGLLVAGSGERSEPAPTQVAVDISAPAAEKAPAPQPAEPTLQGATPVFEADSAKAAPSEVDPAKAIVKSAPEESGASAEDAGASSATASSSAKASRLDGPPAGTEALAVARDFADAFVLYETGETDAEVRETFAETASAPLSRALLERPPRLPANVEVPKAKVVNLVPAPSQGDVYPISVSLLRVGVTSELRVDMELRKGEGWRVTNVLG
jgi:hypothetical protein